MIVLVLVAGLAVLAVSRLGSSRGSAEKAMLRHLTSLSKQLHTRAKLQGATYRIVFDLKDGGKVEGEDDVQSYWVEKSDSKMLTSKEEEEEVAQAEQDAFRDKEKPLPNKGFATDGATMREPREIPPGLVIEEIELSRLDAPIRAGKAYIHFLPQGLVDEAAIHFTGDRDRKWTISIHPLTGKAELISNSLSLRDIKNQ